mgnify:CR=1 FL=1
MAADELIYQTARAGSPVNPGLPAALSYLLVAQAKHETGNFTSNFYKKYNNAFGYSYVSGGKYQTGPGSIADNGQPIASYPNVKSSVYEIIDWIYRRRAEGKFPQDLTTITTPEQYATLLKQSGYYGDTLNNYLNGLKKFFLSNPVATAAGGTGLLLIAGILVYLYIKK